MRLQVQSLASISGLRIQCCCELWCRLAATAPIRPLAWELPYATGVAQEKAKRKKERERKRKKRKKEGRKERKREREKERKKEREKERELRMGVDIAAGRYSSAKAGDKRARQVRRGPV